MLNVLISMHGLSELKSVLSLFNIFLIFFHIVLYFSNSVFVSIKYHILEG